nr:LOW QUALITY PROTEIN: GEM-interacting protein [Dasypus novemcinctus]
MDAAEPELPPAPEGKKRYSDIFRSLDNLEISLGNVTLEMLAGDPVLSGDPNPDQGPRATLPQSSEPSCWSGPSPEVPAPLTGRGLQPGRQGQQAPLDRPPAAGPPAASPPCSKFSRAAGPPAASPPCSKFSRAAGPPAAGPPAASSPCSRCPCSKFPPAASSPLQQGPLQQVPPAASSPGQGPLQQVPPCSKFPLQQVPPAAGAPAASSPCSKFPLQQVPLQQVPPCSKFPLQQVPLQQVPPAASSPVQQVPLQQVLPCSRSPCSKFSRAAGPPCSKFPRAASSPCSKFSRAAGPPAAGPPYSKFPWTGPLQQVPPCSKFPLQQVPPAASSPCSRCPCSKFPPAASSPCSKFPWTGPLQQVPPCSKFPLQQVPPAAGAPAASSPCSKFSRAAGPPAASSPVQQVPPAASSPVQQVPLQQVPPTASSPGQAPCSRCPPAASSPCSKFPLQQVPLQQVPPCSKFPPAAGAPAASSPCSKFSRAAGPLAASSPVQQGPPCSAGSRRLVKAPSTGTESSDDLEERDPDLGDGLENGTGSPFRKWTLSSAALTHRLRRLRGPAKCRECEAFMVSGTECEECFLTCHKRCLETLLILCGHRRLPPRTPLFGVDFLQLPRDFPEEVPFVVSRCTAEIEHRALGVQGIYRVSGSRARVERLCQAFENGRALVDLSGNSPHDVSGVLKRFLQELSDPVVPFHLYDAFISVAKSLRADSGEAVCALRALLGQLPGSHYNTLRHLVAHLFRVAARLEENKMSANNLGIVFGPTLLRPPGDLGGAGPGAVTCLLDSGHQAQLVEFLIAQYEQVFGMDELPPALEPLPHDPSLAPGPLVTGLQPPPPHLAPDPLPPAPASDPDPDPEPQSALEQHPEATPPESEGTEEVAEDTRGGEGEATGRGPEDSPLGTQSRGHFSRQPVKYPRGGMRPVTHQLSSLALVASKLCEETPATSGPQGSLRGRGASSAPACAEGSPLRRAPLPKHFEITQETARLLSKLHGDTVARASCHSDPQPEEVEEHL